MYFSESQTIHNSRETVYALKAELAAARQEFRNLTKRATRISRKNFYEAKSSRATATQYNCIECGYSEYRATQSYSECVEDESSEQNSTLQHS